MDKFQEAKQRVYDYIDIMSIQAKHGIYSPNGINRKLLVQEVTEYLIKKRMYVQNVVKKDVVYTKGFVCVSIKEGGQDGLLMSVWHDTGKQRVTPVNINSSVLTGLPIVLNYMERINNG